MKTEHIIKGKVAFLSQGIWRKGGGRSWGKERGKEISPYPDIGRSF